MKFCDSFIWHYITKMWIEWVSVHVCVFARGHTPLNPASRRHERDSLCSVNTSHCMREQRVTGPLWALRALIWLCGLNRGCRACRGNDGVIGLSLLLSLLSAQAWMPLFILSKCHIMGHRRVGYPALRPWGSQVERNRRQDERDSNYAETKTTLSPNNYFWWETREFEIKTFLSGLRNTYRYWRPVMGVCDWPGAAPYLMVIGWGPRTQEVTAWFPQSLPVRTGKYVKLGSTVHTPTRVWKTLSLCVHVWGSRAVCPGSVCFFVVLWVSVCLCVGWVHGRLFGLGRGSGWSNVEKGETRFGIRWEGKRGQQLQEMLPEWFSVLGSCHSYA